MSFISSESVGTIAPGFRLDTQTSLRACRSVFILEETIHLNAEHALASHTESLPRTPKYLVPSRRTFSL